MRKTHFSLMILAVLVAGLLLGCGAQETGRLQFVANGEDFVRQGFVSKDGWAIGFDHVYINLADNAIAPESKSLFEGIAKVEGKHKHLLETEYDNCVYRSN